MIRTSYDPEADAMFVWFGPEGVKSAGTEEVSPGIMLDFDNEGRVIGLEVLDVRADEPVESRRPAICRSRREVLTRPSRNQTG